MKNITEYMIFSISIILCGTSIRGYTVTLNSLGEAQGEFGEMIVKSFLFFSLIVNVWIMFFLRIKYLKMLNAISILLIVGMMLHLLYILHG